MIIDFVTLMILMLAQVHITPREAEVLAQETIDAARSNGEDPILYAALITKESHWDKHARNPIVGAYGLSQLHPDFYPGRATTWQQLYTGATVLAEYRAKCGGTAGTLAAYRSGRCQLHRGPATRAVLKLYWKWRARYNAFVKQRASARLVGWPTSASVSLPPSRIL